MPKNVRYLLLQIRNDDDPMVPQEVQCFARALRCPAEQISVVSLLKAEPSQSQLEQVDVVLLGGSGHYSATANAPWLDRTCDTLRRLYDLAKPTFASCFGFQVFARAMAGEVVHDLERAELGTHRLQLTDAGREDPIFGVLNECFRGQMGHEDRVNRLPQGATLLASSSLVENQAYRFDGKPIYCTQFHPELNRRDLLERVRAYPSYIERVAGMTVEKFVASCHDTPETEAVLRRFVETVLA